MELFTAFIIGLFGSFHCIGMCGPIALALPGTKLSNRSFLRGRLLYNLGRVITYSLLGALFGFLGNRIALFGFQQLVSIVIGVIFILIVILPHKLRSVILPAAFINRYNSKLKSLFAPFFNKGSDFSLLSIGILNGFLPCGFVYIGIAGAIAVSSSGILNSVLFMTFFGMGTIPAMFSISLIGNIIEVNFKQKLLRLAPVFVLILGIIFVFRGLNLGIPYLSPKLQNTQQTRMENTICH